ncbi:MAG: hypothetical protein IJD90_02335, partial [Clostridia bacterium]|nr:hypothetical protein [Clostridia bacterium]
ADADSGSFDEDGYFVAGNKFGDAVINAVSGGEVVGTTTISIIAPDSISFVEDSVAVKDIVATAGRPVYLPVVGYFGNKPISVNEEDVVLSVANEADGTFDGFNFTPNETYSGAKAVEVTATLKADQTKTATIIVYIYGQTEVDFDFNNTDGSNYKPLIQETVETTETISFCKKCNKTAGTTCKLFHRSYLENRTQTTTKVNTIQQEVPKSMAWNRDIRHTVEDVASATYTGTRDPYKTDYQLVYTIGVDVTKVELPSGSDTILKLVDSAGSYESAWDTMCSLAPRITTDTTITVQVEVSDKDAEVNLDDMFILSDFFEIKSASVDDNNNITIVINWKVQYSAVDPTTENPIVVVGGIKCKFPDKARNGSYNIKTSGSLAYHVCMLTSTGYKYAGLLSGMGGGAYTKSEGAQSGQNSDQGIYLDKNNVISYADSFTLLTPWQSGVWKDGRYYIDNELATGIQYAPTESDASVERYYDFGEDGTPTLYNGRLTHEGLLCDVVDGVMHPVSGWQDDNCYYVDGAKVKGVQLLPEKDVENATEKYCYNFNNKGKFLGKYTGLYNDNGTYRYSYLGSFAGGWQMIDDEWYYFDETTLEAVTGEYVFDESRDIVYELDQTGKVIKGDWYHDGLGYKYYYGPTDIVKGLHTIEGKQYYFMNRHLYETGIYYMELATGNGRTFYQIDENNEFAGEYQKDGLIECVDGLYYGIGGKPQTGLFKVDGYYYYFNIQYKAVKNCKYNVSARNGLTEIPYGVYEFDADGKLVHKKGIFTIGENMYYYENSAKCAAGLIKVDGDYYYAKDGGLVVKGGTYTVDKTSCDLPAGEKYKFGADGKMLDGLVNEGKYTFYYENGKRVKAGLVEIDGDYYYIDDNCLPKTNGTYTIQKSNIEEIPVGSKCKFDADGKMLQGLVLEGKYTFYYKNGKRTPAGLVEIDGNYYYIDDNCLPKTNGTYTIKKSDIEEIPVGSKCKFDADGKMYQGLYEEGTAGNVYYYKNGQRTYAGLVEIDGNYYYAK